MLLYKCENGDEVDIIAHTKAVCERYAHKTHDLRIYVGCDSQNGRKMRKGSSTTVYATVVAFRYGARGAHFIYTRERVKKIKDRYIRLWGEVERSLEVAKLLKENGINVFRVDLDFNEKEIARSSDMVKAAKGYIIGHGFDCEVKPEMLIAAKAADHLVRKK